MLPSTIRFDGGIAHVQPVDSTTDRGTFRCHFHMEWDNNKQDSITSITEFENPETEIPQWIEAHTGKQAATIKQWWIACATLDIFECIRKNKITNFSNTSGNVFLNSQNKIEIIGIFEHTKEPEEKNSEKNNRFRIDRMLKDFQNTVVPQSFPIEKLHFFDSENVFQAGRDCILFSVPPLSAHIYLQTLAQKESAEKTLFL